ncbi:MAG: hypothetical protein ACRDBL_09005 [Rhabdaerophilum sp.]
MAKWARMDGNKVVETFEHDTNPVALFDPAWVWISCPAQTVQGSTKSGSTWTHPAPEEPEPVGPAVPIKRSKVSPVEYFSLFTPIEEFNIREASAGQTDPAKILNIFLRRLDHPSLAQIDLASTQVQQGLGLLVSMGLISPARKAEIEQGV